MKTKIPIKRYVMDESLSWEERYKQLDNHHQEETSFLIATIERFERNLDEMLANTIALNDAFVKE